MTKEIERFIKKFSDEIAINNAALFAGAGFSKPAGYVDWKELLRDVAYDLQLDINKEKDLVTLSQYYCNKNSRNDLDEIVYNEFTKDKEIDINHKIIANLPIHTYWTTNYDSLIEDALEDVGKCVDVKRDNKSLSTTLKNRDAIVYKMHGDKSNLSDVVLIKDDYETYYRNHKPFITALTGDLISKTFLFIGFSFNDPNLDYILSRIHVDYHENKRMHYAFMKIPQLADYDGDKNLYEYQKTKFDLFIDDLKKRYNIQPLLLNNYSEITKILEKIDKRVNSSNVFISGSACEYGDFSKDEAISLMTNLSKTLIKKDYHVISGFGLGVGSYVITGALEEIYMNGHNIKNEQLILRPFPQNINSKEERIKVWTRYRKDMISRAGISIFIFGNKLSQDQVLDANGVRSEYEIAKEYRNIIIPVGCTGYVAKDIWNEMNDCLDDCRGYKTVKLKECFKKLNEKLATREIIENVMEIIYENRL